MRKLIILCILMILSIINTNAFSGNTTNDKVIKLRIYGHVFNTDKNNALKNMKIYITKDNKEISSTNSNKDGYYDFVLDNRDDYLNLCIKSNNDSTLKNIDFCTVISAFQKIGTIVDGVETREVEYDFYTNDKNENLNERLEDEITNSSENEEYDKMQQIQQEYQDKVDEEQKKLEEQKKQDDLKAKYRMPVNTEMSGPLGSIQVVGTVVGDLDFSGAGVIPEKTKITIVDQEGFILESETLSQTHDFNITVNPKNGDFFLHPLSLKIENSQTDENGNPIFENSYKLLTKEKNIFNFYLKKKEENNNYIIVQKPFPIIPFLIIIVFIILLTISTIKNKTYLKRFDY